MPIRSAEESLNRAQEYLHTIRQEFGLDHEKSLTAEQSVIAMTIHSGRYDNALMLLQEMLPRSERLLGPTHRIVLAAKYSTGACTYHMGDEEEGLTQKWMQLYEKPKTFWGSMTAQSALEG